MMHKTENCQIKLKSPIIKSHLCDYSYKCVLVKETITVTWSTSTLSTNCVISNAADSTVFAITDKKNSYYCYSSNFINSRQFEAIRPNKIRIQTNN